jgi:hypothetical protein
MQYVNMEDATMFHRIMKYISSNYADFYRFFMRSWFTAFYTPIYYSYLNGHFKSSFKKMAVSRNGDPLPWYTYPAIDFLRTRNFMDKDNCGVWVVDNLHSGGQNTLKG